VEIVEYEERFQPAIDRMMEEIQSEYSEKITTSRSTKINEAYKLPNQKYWVALEGETVAGTIGLVLISNHNAVVKRMMVHPAYRGEKGVSKALLLKSFEWGRSYAMKKVYLGTMAQFVAAQKFYTKNGFKEIALDDLPVDMPVNTMDSIHYVLELD
jgi:N-acetylglutamate synthase-like GNAT family acetyltransferase